MRRRRLTVSVASALAAFVAIGCGETIIDADKAEKFIAKTVNEQAGSRVKTVVCPEKRPAKAGDKFDCEVTGTDGTKGAVEITQRDDEGNVNVAAPFLHMREVEASITTRIRQTANAAVKVTCPEIVIPKKDLAFDCDGTDGAKQRPIGVTLTNDEGGFRFEVR